MSFSDEEELLTEYTQWVAEKKVAGDELTPAAFLIDRAKKTALQRTTAAADKIKELQDIYLDGSLFDSMEDMQDAIQADLKELIDTLEGNV